VRLRGQGRQAGDGELAGVDQVQAKQVVERVPESFEALAQHEDVLPEVVREVRPDVGALELVEQAPGLVDRLLVGDPSQ
jgi:hypothetical protein